MPSVCDELCNSRRVIFRVIGIVFTYYFMVKDGRISLSPRHPMVSAKFPPATVPLSVFALRRRGAFVAAMECCANCPGGVRYFEFSCAVQRNGKVPQSGGSAVSACFAFLQAEKREILRGLRSFAQKRAALRHRCKARPAR